MTTTTTTLEQALNDYLAVRRALGFKLAENGRLLPDFVAYLDAAGASTVTTELAVAWATQPTGCTPVWWARRLAMVRGFARHLSAIDAGTEVPPSGVLPHRCRRAAPYLYSDADVAALMAAARALRCPLRAATYETVDRAAGRHRDALRGGAPPGPRSPRLGRGGADGVELEVPTRAGPFRFTPRR